MPKREKSSFIKLCDKLEDDYFPYENEISYVRRYLKEELKISKDLDMLLKIKAEGEEMNYNSNFSIILSLLVLYLSFLSIFYQLKETFKGNGMFIAFILATILFILIAYKILNDDLLKSKHFKKWKKYVLCVINQLIEEHKEEVKSKIKNGKKVKDI